MKYPSLLLLDSLIRRAELHVLAANYVDAVKDYEAVLKTEGLVNRSTIELRLFELRQKIVK